MTAMQEAVVARVLCGMQQVDIAKQLSIPLRSVKHHLAHTYKAIGLTGRGVRRIELVALLLLSKEHPFLQPIYERNSCRYPKKTR